MNKKVCKECKEEKQVVEFYRAASTKDGRNSKCKKCIKIYRKNYCKNNPDKIKDQKKRYRNNNVDKIKKQREEYYIKKHGRKKKYNKRNPKTNKEFSKEYYNKNKKSIIDKQNKRRKLKRKNNPLFVLKVNLRCSLYKALKNKKLKKDSKTRDILGISYNKFIEHLNNNPYGFKYNDEGIDLDHIIPVSSGKTKEEIYKLNHWSNFQLLPSEYNRNIKSNRKFNRKHFENWLESS